MYDYLSLSGNSDFSSYIGVDHLKQTLSDLKDFHFRSQVSGFIQIGDYRIVLQGIKCDNNGNYAFDNDFIFEEINLIEINIPNDADPLIEDKIRQIAIEIGNKLNWQIEWRK